MVTPTKKYRAGQVVLTQWDNEKQVDGKTITFSSYKLEKSYKDGEEWKTTNSYQKRELAQIQALVTKALNDEVKEE